MQQRLFQSARQRRAWLWGFIFVLGLCGATLSLQRAQADTLPAVGETVRLNPASPGSVEAAALSADGRYLLFDSNSTVLVPNDTNNYADLFIRDMTNNSTQRVNLVDGGTGQATGGGSTTGAISANGQVVAFISSANNLTTDNYTAGRAYLFVRNLANNSTLRINGMGGVEPNGTAEEEIALSPDGEYVAFTSHATNLTSQTVTQIDNQGKIMAHVYVWGPRSNSPTVRMVDVTPANATCVAPNNLFYMASFDPVLSDEVNGQRYVAFASSCGDLSGQGLSQSYGHLYRRNLNTAQTEWLSKDLAGNPSFRSTPPTAISANGCFVLFNTNEDQFVSGDNNTKDDVFLWDCNSTTSNKLSRVSLANTGAELDDDSTGAKISDDGRYVMFYSSATNAVAGDTNNKPDIFVRDRVANTTQRVSLTASGGELSQGVTSSYGDLSADGHYVAFLSASPELGVDARSVFRRDWQNGGTVRANVPQQAPQADGASVQPSLSSGKRYVAFATDADNLFGGPYTYRQIFVRDLANSGYRLASHAGNNIGNGDSSHPMLAGDNGNCRVVYESAASNLVADGQNSLADTNGVSDIYVGGCSSADHPGDPYRVSVERDFLGTTKLKEMTGESHNPAISRDGQVVVFESNDTQIEGPAKGTPGTPQLYLADLDRLFGSGGILIRLSGDRDYSNGSNVHPTVSEDGGCVAWASNATNNLFFGNPTDNSVLRVYLARVDLMAHLASSVSLLTSAFGQVNSDYPSLSADCHYLTLIQQKAPASTTYQLLFYDLTTFSFGEVIDADLQGVIDKHAAISDNGRFVTYCSRDPNTMRTVVYSFDRALDQRTLVSRTAAGQPPNDHACAPDSGPSADSSGRLVAYSSAATDLVNGDTNNVADIFGYALTAPAVSSISFASASRTVSRGAGLDVPVTVKRSGPLELPAAVRVLVSPGDNTINLQDANLGYSESLTFTVGQAERTVKIHINPYDPARPASGVVQLDLFEVVTATIDAPTRFRLTFLNLPPTAIAGLTAHNSSPTPVGETTYFTADVAGGTVSLYTWDFGDGATATGQTVTHVYAAPNGYTASIHASNGISDVTVSTVAIITQRSQSISFNALPNKVLGDPPFILSATASSNLPVTFASNTPATCTVNDVTVTLVATGNCTIIASQAGDATYAAAPDVALTFAIRTPGKQDQTINFAPLPNRTVNDAPFTINAAASSGLVVTFSSNPPTVCTVNGDTVTLTGQSGVCTLTANQAGDSSFNPATPVNQSFIVIDPSKQNQTITFAPLANKTLGDAPFTISASTSSGLAVTFSSNTPTVCTVNGKTVTLLAVGTCILTAAQAGDANFNPAPLQTQSFTVQAGQTNGGTKVYLPFVMRGK